MEGNAGVPLRFPRPSMAPVAVALVVAWVAFTSAPALADQARLSEWWLPELHITAAHIAKPLSPASRYTGCAFRQVLDPVVE